MKIFVHTEFEFAERSTYTRHVMAKKLFDTHARRCSVLLLGIYAPYNKTTNVEGYFDEFVELARSNGLCVDLSIFMRIREIDPAYFITRGKLEEVKKFCEEHDIDHVVVSEPLTAQQERNLRDYLDCRVFDRTQLILEIFEKAAHSAEGKTQVRIAMLQHKKSRVAGRGIHMSQQSGFIGLRAGPGETAKERELRHLEEHILKLKDELKRLEKTRATQRKRRLGSHERLICIIGYTNAGKSTIFNALTKSDVLAENKLFATLDTTTRELFVSGQKIGLISDTVGFIQNLPHNLIEAFKSTLSELQYADLLLEIIDSSDPNWQHHTAVVSEVLQSLKLGDKSIAYVFNKIDNLQQDRFEYVKSLAAYEPRIITSAVVKDGLDPLRDFLRAWRTRPLPEPSS